MAILARNTTFVDGNTLASSDLHTEFDNIYNGLIPAQLEDESSDAAAHQAMSDPTGGALPASLKTEIQQLRYKIDEIQGTTHWYTAAPDTLTNLNSTVANLATQIAGVRGFMVRPRFVWQDNDEIEIHGGAWEIAGRVVRLAQATTVTITPTSSETWNYLYLDESNITALSSYTIDSSSIRTSTTAPSWSSALNGWYNSSDRCICAFHGDSTGVKEFYHDGGDLFQYAAFTTDTSYVALNTTWVDVTLTAPAFATATQSTLKAKYVDAANTLYWRTNGQTASVSHEIAALSTDSEYERITMKVISDSTQKIEIKAGTEPCTNQGGVDTHGWYFPHGM